MISRHLKRDSNELFDEGIQERARPLLELCFFALESLDKDEFPCRDFLIHLHQQSTRLEELLDYHGARRNATWFAFRESVAAAKLFADVTYEVKHIQGALPQYELKDIESDFVTRTDEVIEDLERALVQIGENLIAQARRRGILDKDIVPGYEPCREEVVKPLLPFNRKVRHASKVGEVVVYLATRFLNLSEDRDVQLVLQEREPRDYAGCVPDPISEEELRTVQARFHNLQSLYDTYVFESDIEQQNADLRYLRGHISVIFHLMEMATDLSHYYIRHMSAARRHVRARMSHPMRDTDLLHLLFEYPLKYSRLFMESAVDLCRRMISSYSEKTNVEVPIPYYRGFHVRPSTLIARIVAHYGSTVTMTLNGKEYNAAAPLELFRANEEIFAMKRRAIADLLCADEHLNQPVPADREVCSRDLQLLFLRLMKAGKIVIYGTGLDLEGMDEQPAATLAELATQVIRHFVSVGQMDIRSDLTVTFSGDSRALGDLETLANHGYGEDQMGNNIVLPTELSYLKR